MQRQVIYLLKSLNAVVELGWRGKLWREAEVSLCDNHPGVLCNVTAPPYRGGL